MSHDDCVEPDTSAVPLPPVLPTPTGPAGMAAPPQWLLSLHAPQTTAQQRQLGLLAALAAFESAGLSPAAAFTAWCAPRDPLDSAPSPAQTRAIAIWAWAARAARSACYSHAVAPAAARLYLAPRGAQAPRPQGVRALRGHDGLDLLASDARGGRGRVCEVQP